MKPRAIIISIDGFAAFYWRDPAVRAPVLRRLAERGTLAAGMETVFCAKARASASAGHV